MRFPEFVDFKTVKRRKKDDSQTKIIDSLDPVEILEDAYQKITNDIASDLLAQIKKSSPKFFENVVVNPSAEELNWKLTVTTRMGMIK